MTLKYLKYLIAFLGILSIFIAGCSTPTEDEEQNIVVEKRIGDENKYEDSKEISNSEQVQQVKEILNNIDWTNATVDMTHPADYKFTFQFKNPEKEEETELYELWISPKGKNKVELVIDAESKYAQLEKNKSKKLFEILTDEKLSELE